MATPEKIPLTARWCLLRSELAIAFPTPRLALQYQSLHPEARIFIPNKRDPKDNVNDKEVFLPHPEGLVAVRSSTQWPGTYSLVLDFATEKALAEWQRRAGLISQVFSERPLSAYLVREIEGRVLMGKEGGGGGAAGKGVAVGMAGMSLGERTPELYIQDPKNPKRFIHYDPSRDRRERQRQT